MGPLNGPDHGPAFTIRNGEAMFRASFSNSSATPPSLTPTWRT